jgi:hypothetical protein
MTCDDVAPAYVESIAGDRLQIGCEKQDHRRQERTKMTLPGRYMLADRGEFLCETIDISPSGLLLKVDVVTAPGSRVVAYIEGLGRTEGVVVRTIANGFALAVCCTPRKTERLAVGRIEWLVRRKNGEAGERRDAPRHENDSAFVIVATEDQRQHVVELVDISTAGVAFLSSVQFEIGERVELGAQRARVARVFLGGAALTFV